MLELNDLYQEVIIDHNRNPRNQYLMENPSAEALGHNPLCGDKLRLFLDIKDSVIERASFNCKGCAISTASASLMTEVLKGKTVKEAREMFQRFHALVTEEGDGKVDLDKLAVFAGVKNYPSRVKCATLAWHTLLSALDNSDKVAVTE